ncbi:MAG: hypothetical protein JO254_01465, partial [Pseudolabrys sp.]|nr:hypothetical protein [Pseudolabrys sp.]
MSVLVASSVSAYAQAPGERIPLPQPVEGWSPTAPRDSLSDQTPRPTSARTADPWQPVGPQPRGITAGNVTLFPSVTAGAFYDDNV